MKKGFFVLLFVILSLVLCACGGTASGNVPDQVVEDFVLDSRFCRNHYYEKTMNMSWEIRNSKTDSNAHTQELDLRVVLAGEYGTLSSETTARFQYDKASDLWTVSRSSEWTEPKMEFNKKIVGTFREEKGKNSYAVTIHTVDGTQVDASFSGEYLWSRPWTNKEDQWVSLSGSTKTKAQRDGDGLRFLMPIDTAGLPKGTSKSPEASIYLSIVTGANVSSVDIDK